MLVALMCVPCSHALIVLFYLRSTLTGFILDPLYDAQRTYTHLSCPLFWDSQTGGNEIGTFWGRCIPRLQRLDNKTQIIKACNEGLMALNYHVICNLLLHKNHNNKPHYKSEYKLMITCSKYEHVLVLTPLKKGKSVQLFHVLSDEFLRAASQIIFVKFL